MKLTKAQLIGAIAATNDFSRRKASETVEILLEIIKSTLASGEDVIVNGFGKFCVKHKEEPRGRNPETDDSMMLPAMRVIAFRCSGKLRERVNGRNLGCF